MASIHEEHIVIRLSSIVKDIQTANNSVVNDELLASIEAIVQELVPTGIVVEVSKD